MMLWLRKLFVAIFKVISNPDLRNYIWYKEKSRKFEARWKAKPDQSINNIMLKVPQEIKKELIDLDLTQAEVARRLNVTRNAVNAVIHGRGKSKRISEYLKSLRLKKAA